MKRGMSLLGIFCVFLSSGLNLSSQSTNHYLVAGDSASYTHGSSDFIVYKLDPTGKKVWRKNYGGDKWDAAFSLVKSLDGGFMVAGHSYSYVHGELGGDDGDEDFLIYHLSPGGQKLWRKNLGGMYGDAAHSIAAGSDGGFFVAGETKSYVHGPLESDRDLLLYKLDAAGNKLWRKNFGGSADDYAESVLGVPGGGCVLVGVSASFTHGEEDSQDALVYRLDADGNKLWRCNFGTPFDDYPKEVVATGDGGYVIVGGTRLSEYGDLDFMVFRIDASGNQLWRHTFGGGSSDFAESVDVTSDGGLIVGGRTYSYGHGEQDILVYRLTEDGRKLWRKDFGGDRVDACFSVIGTSDGGYLLSGYSYSYVHGAPGCDTDILVYKLDADGNKCWRKNLGGDQSEYGRAACEVLE